MEKPFFKKITIIGVGLLGASIGMAARKKKLAGSVFGFFRNKSKINEAIRLKAIDRGGDNLEEALEGSDLIVLCSPVEDIIKKLSAIKSLGFKNALITDVGSTKARIINAAKGLNFVGSHPLAGSEQSGIGAASPELFSGCLCVIVPDGAKAASVRKISAFWGALGMTVTKIKAKKHDEALAFASHLPHAVAYALISSVPENFTGLSAGGLRDTTRIALSKPDIWKDVFMTNRKEVLKSLDAFDKNLGRLKEAIASKNERALLSLLSAAQKKRSCLRLSK